MIQKIVDGVGGPAQHDTPVAVTEREQIVPNVDAGLGQQPQRYFDAPIGLYVYLGGFTDHGRSLPRTAGVCH
ncbi:hypothetical protein ACH4Y0_13485 [Streptomyces sp. NPDC020707]|uniref:hypothetical protein n=1 Tax=Streptomyces sp. NPDC020707 TaxID=3365084 RepID=UPI003788B035